MTEHRPDPANDARRLEAFVCKTCGHAARAESLPETCPRCGVAMGSHAAPVRLVYRVESSLPPRPHVWVETETRGDLIKL